MTFFLAMSTIGEAHKKISKMLFRFHMASEDLTTKVVWMIFMILFWSLIAFAPIYIHCMENTVAPQIYSGHDYTTHDTQLIQNSLPNSLLFIRHGNEVRLN